MEDGAATCVEHFWRIKFNAGKKDTIDFGNVEVFSDPGMRFWSGRNARRPMAKANRDKV